MEEYDYIFKIVLIGNAGVGKTCLVRRFTDDCFPPGQGSTIGVDFMIKNQMIGGEKIKLQIWDTAGQERFKSITQSYYRSADALIVVYDITSFESFDNVTNWLKEIANYAKEEVPVYLVGNKCDDSKHRQVLIEVGQRFAANNHLNFLETSAKDSVNVEQLFNDLAAHLLTDARIKGNRPYGSVRGQMSDSFHLRDNATSNIAQGRGSCCWLL